MAKQKQKVGEKISHDSFFKSVFEDFPEECFKWIFPELYKKYGKINACMALKEEAKKADFKDKRLVMDTVIQYKFEKRECILVLFEAQHNRSEFDIERLCIYFLSLRKRHKGIEILPVVLFTDQQKMSKPPPMELKIESDGELILYFKYKCVRLRDCQSDDYLKSDDPLGNVLAPLMEHDPNRKAEYYLQAIANLEKLLPVNQLMKYFGGLEEYLEKHREQYNLFFDQLTKERV